MNERQYVAYEYNEVEAPESQVSFYLDCYESFGWEKDDRVPYSHGKLTLRRDSRIINKAELTRLQRNFEACMAEIQKLESTKTSKATTVSLVIGILGTCFMAGSVFAVTAEPPMIWLCVLLAIPAFAGWGAAPIVYKKLLTQRSTIVEELVNNKYEEIYKICEKGHSLL